MTTDATAPDGPHRIAMERLAAFTRRAAGDTAEITSRDMWSDRPDGTKPPAVVDLSVEPHNPRATFISVLVGQDVIVQCGRVGGRWELGVDEDDLVLAEQIIEAVVAGRVSEVRAFARSRVEVRLADGTTAVETGYDGCLSALVVLPGWTRWGARTEYEPYEPGGVRQP